MNLDDVATRKRLYRQGRTLLWSFIIVIAILVGFRFIEVSPENQKWVFLLLLFGFWVPIYHLLEWVKARVAAVKVNKP